MPKRVLVLSAAVGAGHLRAAQAVELALRELDSQAVVQNVDVLELTTRLFRQVYGKAYLDFVNRAPYVLGYFYDWLDRAPSPQHKADRLRRAMQRLNLGKFLKFIRSEPWDVIINTHFLPAEMIAALKRKEQFATPQFTVTTDFETHRLWVNQPCEQYFTATDEGAAYLRHWGVPAETIRVTGIPVHPLFSKPRDRAECLQRQNLLGDRPIVLQLAGGFGVGPIEQIYRAVLSVETPLEVVAVAGRNQDVRRELEQIEVPPRHRARVLGFTEQIDELMAVADVVVTKPGGLTTSECLARGCAIAIVNPIPGQETRNSDFLLENGAAVKVNNTATMQYKLTELLRDAGRLNRLKANAQQLGRPRAAFDVAQTSLDW